MAAPTTARHRVRSAFGEILASILEERGIKIRALSILWASRYGGKPESRRRLLHKYLDEGASPGPAHRAELADLLDLDPSVFAEEAEIRREKQELANALAPLVDVLYDLARAAKRKASK